VRFSTLCGSENLIPYSEHKAVMLSGYIKNLKGSQDIFVRNLTQKALKYVHETFKSYHPSDDLIRRILGISIISHSIDEHFLQFFKRLNDIERQRSHRRQEICILSASTGKIYEDCGWAWSQCHPDSWFGMTDWEMSKYESKCHVMKILYQQYLSEGMPTPFLDNFRKEYFQKFGERLH
jgi:hypothetical protein